MENKQRAKTRRTVIDTYVELPDGTRVQVTDLFRRSLVYKIPQNEIFELVNERLSEENEQLSEENDIKRFNL